MKIEKADKSTITTILFTILIKKNLIKNHTQTQRLKSCSAKINYRACSSVVERFPCTEEVTGSIPVGSIAFLVL